MSVGARPRREFAVDGDSWLAIDAWRNPGDLGLCYLLPLEGGEPCTDDGGDRRAILEPGQSLDALDSEELESLWHSAAPLTDTERRFTGPDGALWLARNTGPVWAESSAASESIGLLLRCLSEARRDVEISHGGPVRDEPVSRLCQMLAGAGTGS